MKIFYLLFVVLLTIQNVVECKRTITGGSSKTSSSSSNSYPSRGTNTNTHSHTTRKPPTSRPGITRPGISHSQPTYYQPGHMPAGATMYHHPAPMAPPTYYSPGSLPPGAVLYPAGQAPKNSNSGPGFGTGLAAGAIAGVLLDRALTPTHNRRVINQTSSGVANAAAPAPDNDRIIIINNGPPGSVTTNSDGTTIINNGGGTQGQANAPPTPVPGSVACYPIMVNQTDPSDPTKVTQVEQIACYEVPVNPQPPPPPQQSDLTQQSRTEMKTEMSQPSSSRTEIILTKKASSAPLVESAQTKQNGAYNNQPASFWTTVTLVIFIPSRKILMI